MLHFLHSGTAHHVFDCASTTLGTVNSQQRLQAGIYTKTTSLSCLKAGLTKYHQVCSRTQNNLATDKITSVQLMSQLQDDSGKRQKIAVKQNVQNLGALAMGALLHAFLT